MTVDSNNFFYFIGEAKKEGYFSNITDQVGVISNENEQYICVKSLPDHPNSNFFNTLFSEFWHSKELYDHINASSDYVDVDNIYDQAFEIGCDVGRIYHLHGLFDCFIRPQSLWNSTLLPFTTETFTTAMVSGNLGKYRNENGKYSDIVINNELNVKLNGKSLLELICDNIEAFVVASRTYNHNRDVGSAETNFGSIAIQCIVELIEKIFAAHLRIQNNENIIHGNNYDYEDNYSYKDIIKKVAGEQTYDTVDDDPGKMVPNKVKFEEKILQNFFRESGYMLPLLDSALYPYAVDILDDTISKYSVIVRNLMRDKRLVITADEHVDYSMVLSTCLDDTDNIVFDVSNVKSVKTLFDQFNYEDDYMFITSDKVVRRSAGTHCHVGGTGQGKSYTIRALNYLTKNTLKTVLHQKCDSKVTYAEIEKYIPSVPSYTKDQWIWVDEPNKPSLIGWPGLNEAIRTALRSDYDIVVIDSLSALPLMAGKSHAAGSKGVQQATRFLLMSLSFLFMAQGKTLITTMNVLENQVEDYYDIIRGVSTLTYTVGPNWRINCHWRNAADDRSDYSFTVPDYVLDKLSEQDKSSSIRVTDILETKLKHENAHKPLVVNDYDLRTIVTTGKKSSKDANVDKDTVSDLFQETIRSLKF